MSLPFKIAFTSAVLSSLLTGCVAGDNELPDTEELRPQTCKEIAARDPILADGAYSLYAGGHAEQPWTVYCADLRTDPKEYRSRGVSTRRPSPEPPRSDPRSRPTTTRSASIR